MDDSLALCWQNINVYVNIKKKSLFRRTRLQRLKVLHNVSGVVRSGNLCAIIGPSGAGKTTLLAAIGQRNTGILHGEIHINGYTVDKKLMQKICGFVPQHNLTIDSLTVREHMNFMATLKMDRRVTKNQQSKIINSITQNLGLSKCSSTTLSKLSGGETKRVSLAVELLTDPPVLICDEPTSGLDSYTALTVIALLRQLASDNKIIICSVHQPASGIFEMFDTVSLLVSGGKLAYFGDVSAAKKFFSELGLVCPLSYNTAEFVVNQLSAIPDKLTEKFTKSPNSLALQKEIESVKMTMDKCQLAYGMDEKFLKFYSVQPPSQKTQLKWLIWRSALDLIRSSQMIFFKACIYIITALIIAIPYIGTKVNQEGIQSIQGLNYTIITETMYTQAYAVLYTFPQEIPVLLREISNGVYRPAPYYFSKVLTLLPKVAIEAILFSAVIYLVTGVEMNHGFFWFCLPVVISAIVSSAYGCCLSAAFENLPSASMLAIPLDLVSYTFSGIFLQLSTVPVYFAWVKYVSRFYYGLEAISILQWKDLKEIPCSENKDIPCINSGDNVLYSYGYHPNNLLFDLGCLLLIFLLMHTLGFIFLMRRCKKQALY
ncbi:protein scarlet-like [Cimex lectularius]|uniref:ABC transporter domain-containing protein n=1 Tax=Cimex lectularius TaxID=79782 RepID=A0A8I6RG64_CIMLE|nr:protein scarlet-like [Cimex lectularius]